MSAKEDAEDSAALSVDERESNSSLADRIARAVNKGGPLELLRLQLYGESLGDMLSAKGIRYLREAQSAWEKGKM